MKSGAFVFFGKSGSGKGTQAKLLIDYLKKEGRKVVYIGTGAGFREFVDGDSYTSKLTKKVLDEGGLLPPFLPIWFWTGQLIKEFSGEEDLVFDGISRRINEAPVLSSALKFYGFERPVIVYINVSDKWATTRLKERGRSDDTDEDIKRRLLWFKEDVLSVLDYFSKKKDYHFVEINGEQTIEEVHEEIIEKIGFRS